MRYVRRLAARTPALIGHPAAFLAAIVLTILWLLWGAVGGFGETWAARPVGRRVGRDVPDRVLAPVHAEPGHARDPAQARRDPPHERRCTDRSRQARATDGRAARGDRGRDRLAERPGEGGAPFGLDVRGLLRRRECLA